MEHKTVSTPKRKRRVDRTTVALIAHDAKKVDIVMFANEHSDTLRECELVATGSTGRRRSGPGARPTGFLPWEPVCRS